MKKSKIKPKVLWMPWHPEPGFAPEHWEWSAKSVRYSMSRYLETTWDKLRKEGWRIVKVRISEVTNEKV